MTRKRENVISNENARPRPRYSGDEPRTNQLARTDIIREQGEAWSTAERDEVSARRRPVRITITGNGVRGRGQGAFFRLCNKNITGADAVSLNIVGGAVSLIGVRI